MIEDFERAVSAEEGAKLIVQVKEWVCGEEVEQLTLYVFTCKCCLILYSLGPKPHLEFFIIDIWLKREKGI